MKKSVVRHKKYYLAYTTLMLRQYPQLKRSLVAWFIAGLPQGVTGYIPAILLFHAIPQESIIGYINVGFNTVTVISSYLLAKYAQKERTTAYVLASAGLFLLCPVRHC